MPPYTFPQYSCLRPFPASFFFISLPEKFSHPATVPRPATPFVGMRVRHASGLCGACRASLDGRREVFVSYGNAKRETQPLINYMVHLHIHVAGHYVNTG